jgi:hypothetical protein
MCWCVTTDISFTVQVSVSIVLLRRLQSRNDQSPHFDGSGNLKSHEVSDHMCACVVHLAKLISDGGLARLENDYVSSEG